MRESSDHLVLNESDWNEQSIQEVEKNGKKASLAMMYLASKTLAEKG